MLVGGYLLAVLAADPLPAAAREVKTPYPHTGHPTAATQTTLYPLVAAEATGSDADVTAAGRPDVRPDTTLKLPRPRRLIHRLKRALVAARTNRVRRGRDATSNGPVRAR